MCESLPGPVLRFPSFRPSRRAVRRMRDELCRGTNIHCALDSRERPLHCHHEKTIVIDDRVAFVGGIDLTAENGDRFDSSDHHARAAVGWHDVSTRIEGPAVADVSASFPHALARGDRRDATTAACSLLTSSRRRVPTRCRSFARSRRRSTQAEPRGDFRILESYVRALRSAQSFIYLENQFLWSPEIVKVLRDKLEEPPNDSFRIVLVLPVKPNSGGDDTRGALAELIAADNGRGPPARMHALRTTRQPHRPRLRPREGRNRRRPLAHDRLSEPERTLLVQRHRDEHRLPRPDVVRSTRLRLWAEHLELGEATVSGDPQTVIDAHWRPIAEEQLARREAGQPLTHRLVELPHLSRRSERLLGPLQGLLVDG